MGTGPAAEDRTADIGEAALLVGLRADDPVAYEQLVRTYGGRLLATLRRLVGNEEDARDALQDALISAFKSIDGFEGHSRLSTWLQRIAINSGLMRLRRRARVRETSIEALLPKFHENGHAVEVPTRWRQDAAAALQRRETRALIRRRIDELPDTYRTVLLLRDILEIDTEQTAELLDINPGAVKTRLHRARLALRTLLDPDFRGDAA